MQECLKTGRLNAEDDLFFFDSIILKKEDRELFEVHPFCEVKDGIITLAGLCENLDTKVGLPFNKSNLKKVLDMLIERENRLTQKVGKKIIGYTKAGQ